MSLILKLLGFTGLPQWACELVVIGVVALGVAGLEYHVYEKGKAAEIAAIQKKADRDTKIAQDRADTAEHSHAQELTDLRAYRDGHPDQPVRLCLDNPVRPAARAVQLERGTGPAPGSVQPVPAGDPSGGPRRVGPDIFGMLDALAARADEVSAQLRVHQAIRK